MNDLSQPQPRRVLPLNSAITFLGFLDTHLLIPVMALYASDLGASPGIIGLIIGLYSLTNTPANLLAGRWIDRVGYKLPLTLGLIGDALSMFLYSLCRFPVQLALVRALHGLSGGMIGPATMSVAAAYSEKSKLGRAMGIYGISLAAATLVGYGLGGVIASRLGYNVLFLFGMGFLAVGAVLSLLLPKAKKVSTAAKTSLAGDLRKARDLLKRKGLKVAYASIFAQYFAFGGVVTLLPLYVKSLGMAAFHVGMLLAIFAVMFIILQLPSGTLSDKKGRLMPIVSGLILGIVSLAILPTATTFPYLAAVMALYGIAYGLFFPSISALLADHTSPEERGTATGLFHAFLTAGVAIGAPVMGWAGGVVGEGLGLMLSSAVLVFALVIALTTLRHT
jgi:MFS family permease